MKQIDDGGPAFPGKVCVGHDPMNQYPVYEHKGGMSLRDYFAAKAMQGELAAQDARHQGKGTGIYMPDGYAEFAANCYRLADAMLEARKK